MRKHIKRRPSASLIVAILALFVSLGGTGYAAITITGRNIKNGSITNADLGTRSVRSSNVEDGSLLSSDFKLGQLPAGARGPAGPAGNSGAPGTPGSPGAPGAPGLSGYEVVVGRTINNQAGTSTWDHVDCPNGKHVLGGGVDTSSSLQHASTSAPWLGAWSVLVKNTSAFDQTFTVNVICAKVAQ